MIPYSKPKRSDLYTLSQSKLLENHALHSGIYLYSPYMAVVQYPPPPSYNILCLNLNFIFLKGAKLLRGNPCPTHEGTVTGALNYQQHHIKFLSIRRYTPA